MITSFPTEQTARFLLEGPAGPLETLTTYPKTSQKPLLGVAVICHPHPLYGGNMNNKVVYILAQCFQELGLPTVRFNFRGVGNSQGQYDQGIGETNDLLALLKWLKVVCPEKAIYLAGFSFGAYIAVKASKNWPTQQLICVAPPIENFPEFKLLFPFTCPWILIQGDKDEVVSPDAIFSWVNSLNPPPELIIIKDASHFFHGKLIELRDRLIEKINKPTS